MDNQPRLLKIALLASACALFAAGAAASVTDGCADCHGKDGVSTEPEVPTIAGLSHDYLHDQLASYAGSKRPCPETKYRGGDKKRAPTTMCKIASGLKAAELDEVATFFAGKPFAKSKQKFDPAKAAAGKKIHEMACDKCHSEGGSVQDDDAGILAGQWMDYLDAQLKDYKSGKREAPAKMKPKIDALKPDDIAALVHYYGSQQ